MLNFFRHRTRGHDARRDHDHDAENHPQPPPAGHKAYWLSIDPRTSRVELYPDAVQEALEAAYLAGSPREVPLEGLGEIYAAHRFVVDLGRGLDHPPTQLNPRTDGRRDVRRVVVPEEAEEFDVLVFRKREWKIADVEVPSVTEKRTVNIAAGKSDAHIDDYPSASSSSVPRAPQSTPEERIAKAAEDLAEGKVGLWEWSQIPNATKVEDVDEDNWGVYTKEQNDHIEAAYAAGEAEASVSIGIRDFQISFRTVDIGRQVDKAMRKRRLVRRRPVTQEELNATLTAAVEYTNQSAEIEGLDCAICCSSFADTPTIPVVILPSCGHKFHGACVQNVADHHGTCPFCRAEVDWEEAMHSSTQARRAAAT